VPLTAAERLERLGLVTPDARLAATDLPLLVGVREGLREVSRDALDVPSFVAVCGETTPSVLRPQRAVTSYRGSTAEGPADGMLEPQPVTTVTWVDPSDFV
jgi:hypothetical protein